MSRAEVAVDQIDTSDAHGRLAKTDALAGKCWICSKTGRDVIVTRTKIEFEKPGYWVSCRAGCRS